MKFPIVKTLSIGCSFRCFLSLSFSGLLFSHHWETYAIIELRGSRARARAPALVASLRSSHGLRSSAEIPAFIRRARRLETIDNETPPARTRYCRCRSKRASTKHTQYGTVRHEGKNRRRHSRVPREKSCPSLVSRDAAPASIRSANPAHRPPPRE